MNNSIFSACAVACAPFLVPAALAAPQEGPSDPGALEQFRAQAAHAAATALLEVQPDLQYDPASLLVRWLPRQSEGEREALRTAVGLGRLRSLPGVPNLELIHVQGSVEDAIAALRPLVEYAEPNYVVRAINTPNDTYFDLTYGLHNTGQTIQGQVGIADADIDATEAWNTFTGDPNFAVAVIDTGVDWDHPDLAANIWSNPGEVAGNGVDDDGNGYVDDVRGWDFYDTDNNPDDADGHGSHCAGTVGAVGNNGVGVAGVNWRCKIVPLRFLGPQGGFTSDAVLAVSYCTTNGIRVSNNSWGGGGFSQALFDAIQGTQAVGHVFCAAAGNSGTNNDSSAHYPSNYDLPNVLSVAATDNRDGLASFSNYGATSVDLAAPGVDIASTYAAAGYVYLSGTSMATPHVAGVATLLLGYDPGLTWQQAIDRLLSTVRPVSSLAGITATGGVVNAAAALAGSGGGGGGGGDTTPPAAPSGLTATAGNAVVDLGWSANGEADLAGYRVYRSTTSGSGFVELTTGLQAATSYSDGTVTNGTTYFYVVAAEDAAGNLSSMSTEASATPQDPGGGGGGGGTPEEFFFEGFEDGNLNGWTTTNNVSIRTGQVASGVYSMRVRRNSTATRTISTAGYESLTLAYAKRSNNYDNGEVLVVEWSANGGSTWTTLEVEGNTGWTTRSFSLPADAADNASFTLRYRTNANRNNENTWVDDISLVGTPVGGGGGGGPDVTPPADPTGLSATGGDAVVDLAWSANGEADLAGYRVYRSTTSGGGYVEISGGLLTTTAASDVSVTNGTTYFYVVAAEDTSGNLSGFSAEASATPEAQVDTTPPDAPTGLTATGGDAEVSLNWSANGEADLAGYRVYRSTTPGAGYVEISGGGLLTGLSLMDTAVTNGTTYFYVVRAEDTSGNVSGDSNEASATPSAPGGPGTPEVLFSDGFESDSLDGWQTQNGRADTFEGNARTGSFVARLRRTTWMQRTISTVGYDTITLSASVRQNRYDSGERMDVQYWNGSSWTTLDSITSTSWSDNLYALPADAANRSDFRIRFITNANRSNESGWVDDVVVSGTPL